jgi:hypothetical protein
MLAKNPGFAAITVITLALGIGANTPIFSVVNSVLPRTLPVKDLQQLVFLSDPDAHGMNVGSEDGDRDLLRYPELPELRNRNQVFWEIFASDSSIVPLNVTVESSNQSSEGARANISMVSGSNFPFLGVNPFLGRAFTSDADRVRDANPVAVVSYAYWQSRFGGDLSVLGRKIRICETPYDILGVAPTYFCGGTAGSAPDIWVPLSM